MGMGHSRKLILAGVAFGALVVPAVAADPLTVRPPDATTTWTRCYVGVTAGGAKGQSDVSWAPLPAGFAGGVGPTIAAKTLASIDSTGFTGGGEGGCNYQTNSWFVVGLEGDLEYTGLNGTNSGYGVRPGNTFTETFSSNWLSTVRVRAGIASGRWLFFATGGWAIANVSFSDSIFFPFSNTTNAASSSGTVTGWTVGGGAEWAFAPRWSVKAEYLYVDLDTTSFASINSNPVQFPHASIVHSHSLTENVGRFGVNYRF